MRARNAIATCLLALSAVPATAGVHAPPQPQQTLDARLDGTSPISLTITHDLFLTPVRETLDAFQMVRLERYLWTAVPMGRTIVYPDEELRPTMALTLSDAQYRAWKNLSTKNSKGARRYLDNIATREFRKRLPPAVQWRTGYADRFAEGLDRAAPFIPYLETIAGQYGLDKRTWMLALQESLFTPRAVSKAWCEGPYQLSRPVARHFGMVVPRSSRGGNTKEVNESLHPLLAAEAAFALVRAYAYHTGGFLAGVSAYHAGPENVTRMRLLQLRNPDWRAPPPANGVLATTYTHGFDDLSDPVTTEEINGENGGLTTDVANALSWMITDGWQHPKNRSDYRRESSLYVPRFLALLNAVDRSSLFATERAVIGERTIRPGQDRCYPRGPFVDDERVCLESVPIIGTRERYLHQAFGADRVTIRYAVSPRPGLEPLKGEDIAKAIGSLEAFTAYNPHIPLRARVPEGTRVFLSPGAAERVHALPIVAGPVVRYDSGGIAPEQPAPSLLQEDREYARLALLRSEGLYDQVTADAICALADRMERLAADDQSWFRVFQGRAARLDCTHTSAKNVQGLIRFSGGGR